MRIETKEIEVYKFEELSDKAKDRARQTLCDMMRENYIFYNEIKYNLRNTFPHSDLDIQYSFSSCQGDGVNIYGQAFIEDIVVWVLKNKGDEFTEKEKRFLRFIQERGFTVKFDENIRYTYYLNKCNDIEYYIEDDLENDYFRNIPYDTIRKFAMILNDMLKDMCKQYEDDGYSYFYDYTDEDAIADSEANEWEFLEDGSIYY